MTTDQIIPRCLIHIMPVCLPPFHDHVDVLDSQSWLFASWLYRYVWLPISIMPMCLTAEPDHADVFDRRSPIMPMCLTLIMVMPMSVTLIMIVRLLIMSMHAMQHVSFSWWQWSNNNRKEIYLMQYKFDPTSLIVVD